MKLKKCFKSNALGFSEHLFLASLVIIAIAAFGVRVLSDSHADSLLPIVYSYLNPSSPSINGVASVDLSKTTKNIAGPTNAESFSPAQYSPNGQYLAWTSWASSMTYGQLHIKNLSTGVVSSFNSSVYKVVGNSGGTDVPLQWYPNSSKLAMEVQLLNSNNQVYNALYTVNVNGSGLTKLPYVSASENISIDSLAVTHNAKYIVFEVEGQGIYAVQPGSKPILLSPNPNCTQPESRPSTPQSISYICEFTSSNTEISSVLYQTVGSPASTLYSSVLHNSIGSLGYYFQSDAWSSDGSKLALEGVKMTYSATCNPSTWTSQFGLVEGSWQTTVVSLSYSTPSSLTLLSSDSPRHVTVCSTAPEASDLLTWSQDNKYIAFLDMDNYIGQTINDRVDSIPSTLTSPSGREVLTGASALPTSVSW